MMKLSHLSMLLAAPLLPRTSFRSNSESKDKLVEIVRNAQPVQLTA